MNTMAAFAMGEANRGRELMVFDWDKAAQLIREQEPETVYAGLRGDWEYTGDCIFRKGKPIMSSDAYLASTWAVPEIELNGEILPCYKMKSQTPGWDAYTLWPPSALAILHRDIIDAEKVEG